MLLTQFAATVTPVLEKALGAGAHLERFAVPGGRVYRDHRQAARLRLDGAGRRVGFEERRLAGATLLIERDDGVLLRVEGELTRARATALARELAGA